MSDSSNGPAGLPRAGRPQPVLRHERAPRADAGQQTDDDGRRVLDRRRLKRLRDDHHPDPQHDRIPASIGIAHAIHASVPVRQMIVTNARSGPSSRRGRRAPSSRDGRCRSSSETRSRTRRPRGCRGRSRSASSACRSRRPPLPPISMFCSDPSTLNRPIAMMTETHGARARRSAPRRDPEHRHGSCSAAAAGRAPTGARPVVHASRRSEAHRHDAAGMPLKRTRPK